MATILVVDDRSINREFLAALLSYAGYAVVEAVDGDEALSAVRYSRPDLIITDLMMPIMDGLALTRELRADPATADIPVVFYTATYRVHEARALARSCGVDTVLAKPSEPQVILDAVARILGAHAPKPSTPGEPSGLFNTSMASPLRELAALQQRLKEAFGDDLQAASEALRGSHPPVAPLARIHSLSLRLAALLELDLTLGSERDPQRLLDLFCRAAQDIVGAHHVGVVLRDPERDSIAAWSASGLAEAARGDLAQIDLHRGFMAEVMRSQEPLSLAMLGGDASRGGLPASHPPIEGLLGAAVRCSSGVAGLLYFADKTGGLSFNPEDEQFAATLAAQLALLYGNLAYSVDLQRHADELRCEIIERKLVTEALGESESRFRQIAENIQEVIFLVDASSSQLLYISPAYETVWGRSCESLLESPHSWMESVHPDDQAGVLASVATQQSEGTFVNQYRIVRTDGSMRWIRARGVSIRDREGNPVRVVGVAADVTEQVVALDRLRESERRFNDMLANIQLVSTMLDDRGCITYANQHLLELTGWRSEEILGKSWFEIFAPPEIATELLAVYQSVLAGHPDAWHHENEILTRAGARRLIRWNNTALRSGTGASIGTASIGEDITERREQERKIGRLSRIRAVTGGISSAMLRLHERDELLQEACRVAATEGVFRAAWAAAFEPSTLKFEVIASYAESSRSPAPRFPDLSEAALGLAGASDLVALSKQPHIVNDIAAETMPDSVREELQCRGFRSGATFPLTVQGEVAAVLVLMAGERDVFDAEEIALLEWLAADLSFALENIDKSQRLEHLTHFDALTGLPNAARFRERLEQFVAAARREQGQVGIVVVDLEGFTQINDTLGRTLGDRLLVQVAKRFAQSLPEPKVLGRIGSDTFAAASRSESDQGGTWLLDQMLAALREPFRVDGQEVRLSAQAGIAFFPNDGEDGSRLFKNAEGALKLAKSSGARATFYSSEWNERIAQRRTLEAQLRVAIETQQFVLYYQPRVDMISGEIVGAEALIRWQHPVRGLVPPGVFIGLAEETGLIVPIGSWAIQTACAQQQAWLAAGLSIVPVAVNRSSLQFERGDLRKIVCDALAAHSLESRHLHLELTESAVMADPAAAASALMSLRALGVGLALDDFGTGYSSLAYLKRFPFDSVKIDRSFVTDITSNAEDAAIANAIIAMGHRLRLKVVAEGIETQGQFNYLRKQGCDEMQGYLFSPPVAAEAFQSLLREGKRMPLPAPEPADLHTLLVVDDEPGMRASLNRLLRRDGYRILVAASGQEALDLLALNDVQVIISDQRMPDMSGTAFLSTAAQLYPETVRIILSGYTDLAVVTDAVNRGSVFKFLTKPWDDDLLREQVRDAFRRHRPERPRE